MKDTSNNDVTSTDRKQQRIEKVKKQKNNV